MIHIRLDGHQLTPGINEVVRVEPYTTRTDTPGNLTVPLTAVDVAIVGVPPGQKDYFLILRNVSAAGQIIGIDSAPTVTLANAGILLYPGEQTPPLPFMYIPFWAISDSTNAELRRWTVRTS